ncbi:tRNA epoxyqueuosine(34) reductase QueG [bacterium]|nr:tRNA epoxyqueuosine(34) reductase QueG [candidate division CSSED10-310 bacterium]
MVRTTIQPNLIKEAAGMAGFQACGIAGLDLEPDMKRFKAWLDAGRHGGMTYLERNQEIRADPRRLLPGAATAVVVAMSYIHTDPIDTGRWVSRHARGRDYHLVMKDRLTDLADRLSRMAPLHWRACVDTAPLLERSMARRAGLGWIGRNTNLITPDWGSFIVLGELLIDWEVPPDQVLPDRCGDCRACIEACPTGALSDEGLAADRCLSYLTIEHRGCIPSEFHPFFGDMFFGCDRCQSICPWNRITNDLDIGELMPRSLPDVSQLACLTPSGFRRFFQDTSLFRARWSGFMRNLVIHVKARYPEQAAAILAPLRFCGDPLVAATLAETAKTTPGAESSHD